MENEVDTSEAYLKISQWACATPAMSYFQELHRNFPYLCFLVFLANGELLFSLLGTRQFLVLLFCTLIIKQKHLFVRVKTSIKFCTIKQKKKWEKKTIKEKSLTKGKWLHMKFDANFATGIFLLCSTPNITNFSRLSNEEIKDGSWEERVPNLSFARFVYLISSCRCFQWTFVWRN